MAVRRTSRRRVDGSTDGETRGSAKVMMKTACSADTTTPIRFRSNGSAYTSRRDSCVDRISGRESERERDRGGWGKKKREKRCVLCIWLIQKRLQNEEPTRSARITQLSEMEKLRPTPVRAAYVVKLRQRRAAKGDRLCLLVFFLLTFPLHTCSFSITACLKIIPELFSALHVLSMNRHPSPFQRVDWTSYLWRKLCIASVCPAVGGGFVCSLS